MSDAKPLKRSEQLAVENVRRIAEQLRAERNDALAMAQTKAEEAERAGKWAADATALLRQACPLLARAGDAAAQEFAKQIEAFLKTAKNA